MRRVLLQGIASCSLLLLFRRASGFIAGIDLGGEFSKFAIALPKQSPEVVTNFHSQRKTPTAFSFVEQTRGFGEDALQHLVSAAPSVARFFPQFLGQKVEQLSNTTAGEGLPPTFFPLRLSADHDRWSYHLKMGELDLAVEEVAAHFLAFGTKISTLAANKRKLQEAVITVPALATQRQRHAILHAAEIAGIQKVKLIHHLSAAALQRARDIEAPSAAGTSSSSDDGEDLEQKEGDSPKEKLRKIQARRERREKRKKVSAASKKAFRTNILIVSMGARRTEVCIIRFHVAESSGNSVTVKGCGDSDEVGGHFFDVQIAQKMLEMAANEHEAGQLERNPKAVQKILAQATRVKHLLSTNKEVPFTVEALHNEKDFAYTINRTEFETWCEPIIRRVLPPIEAALESAKMKLGDVEGVELIGGGWRVPRVQQVLAAYLAERRGADAPVLTLGQHLNGEEAAALGAAYFGASNHDIMGWGPKLRPIPVNDISMREYAISVQKLVSSQPGQDYSSRPSVIFKRGSALGVAQRPLELKAVPFDLKVTLFEDGRAIEVHQLTGLFKAHSVTFKGADAPNVILPIDLDANGIVRIGRVEAVFMAMGKPKVNQKTQQTMPPTKEQKKISLQDTVEYDRPVPMSFKQRMAARKRYREMVERDRVVSAGSAALNALEAYIFSAKDRLASSEVAALHPAEKINDLRGLLDEAESWLGENREGASAQKLTARLTKLKREVDPFLDDERQQKRREELADVERQGTAGTESAKQKAARIAAKNEARAAARRQGKTEL